MTVSGSEFQICEAATGKAWPPMVDVCDGSGIDLVDEFCYL